MKILIQCFESLKAVVFLSSPENLKMLNASVKELGRMSNFANTFFY